jgi:hypothetical protein
MTPRTWTLLARGLKPQRVKPVKLSRAPDCAAQPIDVVGLSLTPPA